jgi:DNA-binding response OmpR family regulator
MKSNRTSKPARPRAAAQPKSRPQPKSKPKAKAGKRAAAAQPGKSRGRLLLVEDHAPTRNALLQLLVTRKFDVSGAATIAEAWALVAKEKFDFLVSDIGLPDGDGYLLMRELQERFGLKGIALTGFDKEDDAKLSREAGFSAHLTKPVQIGILDETLAFLGL